MADGAELKGKAQQKFASIKQKLNKLTNQSLTAAQRVETRNAIVSDFDDVKTIFLKLNELELPK